MSEMPPFTQEQKEQLSELIYGYFAKNLKLTAEVASRIEVEITYNPPPESSTIIENSTCSDDEKVAFAVASTPFTVAALRCVPGSGNGCWTGYRLG